VCSKLRSYKKEVKDSIADRFIITISTNIVKSGLNFVTTMLLARWLGPEDFGGMAFLIGSFAALKALTDMSSSAAFFTFISQSPKSTKFISYYWGWIAFQLIVIITIIFFLIPGSLLEEIWGDTEKTLLILALIAVFMQNTIWADVVQMADAARETKKIQAIAVSIFLVHFLVVVALWYTGTLAVPLVLGATIIEFGVASWLAFSLYRPSSRAISAGNNKPDRFAKVFKMFAVYCLPLIPYGWLSFTHDFGDRWMLQSWGGSLEQAYFAVATQISGVVLLVTSAILRIFWKEIAEANKSGDLDYVRLLYLKTSRLIYVAGCLFVGLLVPWADEIVYLLLGEEYVEGSIALMIMLFYPVHQALGQINAAMYYATENIAAYTVIGSFFMLLGLGASYFALAPQDAYIPGMSLGASGLAVKMVLVQVIGVNVSSLFLARKFKWKYKLSFQFSALGFFVGAGFIVHYLCMLVLGCFLSTSSIMFMALICYIILSGMGIFLFPCIIGQTRSDILSIGVRFKLLLQSISR